MLHEENMAIKKIFLTDNHKNYIQFSTIGMRIIKEDEYGKVHLRDVKAYHRFIYLEIYTESVTVHFADALGISVSLLMRKIHIFFRVLMAQGSYPKRIKRWSGPAGLV